METLPWLYTTVHHQQCSFTRPSAIRTLNSLLKCDTPYTLKQNKNMNNMTGSNFKITWLDKFPNQVKKQIWFWVSESDLTMTQAELAVNFPTKALQCSSFFPWCSCLFFTSPTNVWKTLKPLCERCCRYVSALLQCPQLAKTSLIQKSRISHSTPLPLTPTINLQQRESLSQITTAALFCKHTVSLYQISSFVLALASRPVKIISCFHKFGESPSDTPMALCSKHTLFCLCISKNTANFMHELKWQYTFVWVLKDNEYHRTS